MTEIYDYFRLFIRPCWYSTLSEMRQGDRQADCRSDGGSDYGIGGAHQDPASCTGSTRTQGYPCEITGSRPDASGYVRAEIDGNVYELSEEITLDKNIKHTIAIIVDRLIVKPGIEKRLYRFS